MVAQVGYVMSIDFSCSLLTNLIETMRLSSFTLLLKLHLDRKQSGAKSQSLLDSLKSVVKDNQILYADKCMSSLEILVLSLHDSKDWKPSKTVFEFLDSCVLRFVRKPVHYYDILIELIKTAGIGSNSRNLRIDLLLVTIMEQWSFLVKRTDASTIDNVSTWLVRYIEMARLGVHSSITASLDGEANRLLLYIRDQLMAEVDDKECRATFMKSVTDTPCEVPDILEACGNAEDETNRTKTELLTSRIRSENLPNLMLIGPPEEHDDHVGLTRWVREDVQDAITEGFIGDLVFCLCSKYAEIRKQALTCMRTFVKKLEVGKSI